MRTCWLDELLELHLESFRDYQCQAAVKEWSRVCEEIPGGWLIYRVGNGRAIGYSTSVTWSESPWCVIEDLESSAPSPVTFAETLEECVQDIIYEGNARESPNDDSRRALIQRSRQLRDVTFPSGPHPEQGSAFAFPLENGLYAACRVVLGADSGKYPEEPAVLVFGSAWVGDEVPDVNNPQLKSVLHLTHSRWKGQPHRSWIVGPVPDDFILIGTIEPTADERNAEVPTFAGWDYIRIHPLMQWKADSKSK